MCGICGIINLDGQLVREPELKRMIDSIKHRGPDDMGFFIQGNTGLGNVRLSIIDLSEKGHQPMFSQDKRFCMVYNGEVYNYLELKETLKHKHPFYTETDTEVVLNAFLEWGPACLDKLNGMFALAIYDTVTKELFIARDRFGIKPFYYYLDDNTFLFASEQQAILPFLKKKLPNKKAIYEYLVFNRTDQGDYTFFEGMRKLPHGSMGILKNKKLKINKWYNLWESLKPPFSTPHEYYDAFKESIRLQLRSDVPVGVCLSGGLDSSGIVSVLVKDFHKTDLNTFSAIYEDGEKEDERKFISLYKPILKNMFFTHPTAQSLFEDLNSFITCHSEPVASLGPYAQYKVMELARNHVKVTLDGQGADEQFAGYHYFFGAYFKELLTGFHWAKLTSEMIAYTLRYKSPYAFKYLGLYLLPPRLKDSLSRQAHNHTTNEFFKEGEKESELGTELYNPKNLNQSLMQHFEYKLEHLLKWEDHNSMAHSIESRVPFLDHHVVEHTLSMPSRKIIHKGVTKYFFREAMKDVLPEKIRTRKDKIGFATPSDKWFRSSQFQEYIRAVLHSDSFRERGYLDANKCVKDYERHLNRKINIAKEIWKWINLELWHQKFID